MSYMTPNMNLIGITIGSDTGLQIEQNSNANVATLDQHNHTPGLGVQIPTSGVHFNADVPFNGFNAITLRSLRFTPQPSALSGPQDLGCLYVSGVDLYYNDVNGNQVQMTSGGAVNATSSGISSGTATASFSSGVLVVNAASNTPANIQCAAILMGNNVSGSNYLTLSPPSSMASNFSLTLPTIPASTKFVTIDTSGTLSTVSSVSAAQIASSSITNSQIAAVNTVVSSSSGAFSTTSGTATAVTNLSNTITTVGKPVMVFCQPDGSGSIARFHNSGNTTANVYLYRDGSLIAQWGAGVPASITGTFDWQPSLVSFQDSPSAGSHTYVVKVSIGGGGTSTITASFMNLVTYELK
jgi:hypothetical protein